MVPASSSYAFGVLLIVLVSVIWSAASFVVQDIEGEGVDAYVLTYICNSMFMGFLLRYACDAKQTRPHREGRDGDDSLARLCARGEAGPGDGDGDGDGDETLVSPQRAPGAPPLGARCARCLAGHTLRAAVVLSPMWILAQASYNVSLAETSVSSSTILASTSSAFTLAVAVLLGVEELSLAKVVAALACIAGSTLVALADEDPGDAKQRSVVGDGAALVSAASYGLYTATLRVADPEDVSKLLGCMGAANAVFFAAPLGAYCAATQKCGRGIFRNPKIAGLVIAKGLFDNVLSDWLWARAVMLTSPTAATLGLSLTIPVAFAADALVNGKQPKPLALLGALFVVAGFVGIVWRDTRPANADRPQTPRRPRRQSPPHPLLARARDADAGLVD